MLDKKNILITGGTGSFGSAFIEATLKRYPKINKLIVFSRDEYKQFMMEKKFPTKKYKQIRFFLGDVRDYHRLNQAFKNVDIIIHAAALKQVPAAEYNPSEFIETNINGALNVINAAYNNKVKRIIALSTDKASSPANLYGATKLCSDKLFISSNHFFGDKDIKLSVVRYGNVMGSRGSVLPFFFEKSKKGLIPITDTRMTRFNILMEQCLETVFYAIKNSIGGEMIIPKMPSIRITDLAHSIKNNKIEIVGIRPGEKLHEELISESDSFNTFDIGKYYVMLPSNYIEYKSKYKKYIKKGKKVKEGFSYNSRDNDNFLSKTQIKQIIRKYKSNFEFNN